MCLNRVALNPDCLRAQLTAALKSLTRRCDGIQLMWPLPSHIDSEAAYAVVPPSMDVDGAHFIGSSELRGGSGMQAAAAHEGNWMPVTPDAVLQLLAQRGIQLNGRHALVIGRSRIVGSPLAHALLKGNATVTVAHSYSAGLAALCQAADLVVSCAGGAPMTDETVETVVTVVTVETVVTVLTVVTVVTGLRSALHTVTHRDTLT